MENNSPKTGHGSCVTPAAIASVHPVWAAIVALTEPVTSAVNAPSDICRGSERSFYSPLYPYEYHGKYREEEPAWIGNYLCCQSVNDCIFGSRNYRFPSISFQADGIYTCIKSTINTRLDKIHYQ